MGTTIATTKPAAVRYDGFGTFVTAMQYTKESCAALHSWLDLVHDDGECAYAYDHQIGVEIPTIRGLTRVAPGAYVLRDPQGHTWTLDADRFEAVYTVADPDAINAFSQPDCERVRERIDAHGRFTCGDVSSTLEAAVELGIVRRP